MRKQAFEQGIIHLKKKLQKEYGGKFMKSEGRKIVSILIVASFLLLMGCNMGGTSVSGDYSGPQNVYASGYVYDDTAGTNIAGYWMDGTWIALSDGASSMTAKGIAVDGNDIYAVGDYAGADCRIGGYWENGNFNVFESIQDASGAGSDKSGIYTSSITVYDGGIIIAGEGCSNYTYLNSGTGATATTYPLVGTLWLDDNVIKLNNGEEGRRNAYTESLTVENISGVNMAFIAGYCYADDNTPRASFWSDFLDGASMSFIDPILLSGDAGSGYESIGRSVDVKENEGQGYIAYVCGSRQLSGSYCAGYWKYNTKDWSTEWIGLYSDTKGSDGYSIFLEGNDIYVGGYRNNGNCNVAGYWKNGTWIALSDGTTDACVYMITLAGNTLYAGGYRTNSSGIEVAGYWKGSQWITLGDEKGNSRVLSLFLADK